MTAACIAFADTNSHICDMLFSVSTKSIMQDNQSGIAFIYNNSLDGCKNDMRTILHSDSHATRHRIDSGIVGTLYRNTVPLHME
jgi:hypothetical protein